MHVVIATYAITIFSYQIYSYERCTFAEIVHEVKSDFQAKVPSVLFKSSCQTLNCAISVGTEESCLTSRYMAIYRKLDDRCRKLAVVFKYWAKVSGPVTF